MAGIKKVKPKKRGQKKDEKEENMNKHQKIVLIIYAVVVFILTFLLMPWSIFGKGGAKHFLGFSPILVKPSVAASPDISILLTELFAVTAMALIAFILFKHK